MIVILLADGFEEIEALTPVDVLRRCGLNVKTVGITGKIAVGSHGIAVACDLSVEEVPLSEVTMAIFPGGMPGALNLDASPFTDVVISAVQKNGGRLAAICAAPLVLGRRRLLEGLRATCYPGFEKELTGASVTDEGVVTDGSITTAKGMGVSLDFALELASLVVGSEKALEISDGVMKPRTVPKKAHKENIPAESDRSSPMQEDDRLSDAIEVALTSGKVSTSLLQRRLAIGYGRAARLIDDMEALGIIGPADGARPRRVLITPEQLSDIRVAERKAPDRAKDEETIAEVTEVANSIVELCEGCGIDATVSAINHGHAVTSYEISTDDNDTHIEILAPKLRELYKGSRVYETLDKLAIEVPNSEHSTPMASDIIGTYEFNRAPSRTTVCLGSSLSRETVFTDLMRCKNVVVGGEAHSGAYDLITMMALSLATKSSPRKLKLLLIDPAESLLTALSVLPHAEDPAITDTALAAEAIERLVSEMERRHEALKAAGVPNSDHYNADHPEHPMNRIVAVINATGLDDPHKNIRRLLCEGFNAGIHVLVCTDRPAALLDGGSARSVAAGIGMRLSSVDDSVACVGTEDATLLLGEGDMLYRAPGSLYPIRLQGPMTNELDVRDLILKARNVWLSEL